jgi:hypothetical protein
MRRLFLLLFFCLASLGIAEEREEAELPVNPLSKPVEKPAAKKTKAHFVGVRRPTEKPVEKKRSSIKNQWVKSKTHPKDKKEKQRNEEPEESAELDPMDNPNIPYFYPDEIQN